MSGTKGLYSSTSCWNVNTICRHIFGFAHIQACNVSSRSYTYNCANIGCMLGSSNKTLNLWVNLPWTHKQQGPGPNVQFQLTPRDVKTNALLYCIMLLQNSFVTTSIPSNNCCNASSGCRSNGNENLPL
jgi:hypothetical protein